MSRLQQIFSRQQKALIIFDSCGYPTMAESEERLEKIISGGADILELGVPFSDPMADGPVIQKASQIALAQGATLQKILDMAKRIRARHPETGLVLFGYYNIFLQYGLEKLAAELKDIGIDGILIVDLPYEEREEFLPYSDGIDLIPLIGPSTDIERAKKLMSNAGGFAYCITVRGVTGERKELPPELTERLRDLREACDLPVAAGFGISDPETAAMVAKNADAIVIGSAVVKLPTAEVENFVSSVKSALTKI